ncbi:MFS transporter [Citricoccus sp. NPDC055426]|uniref:MFS transporter n=1 Tax=Citricoccus sp. NPDC055426 TaxID=3155536 RepID=UPI00342E04D9
MAEARRLEPALVYAALSTAVVSSLGMLLVPSIAEAMHVSVSTAQWMLTVNLLVGAVATPVMGRLSDGPRQKRLLLLSLSVILLGSVVAAVAPNFTVFLIGRALQGLTYGIVPVTIALARRCLPAPRVPSAISSLSVTVATGLGVGYPLTGIIAGALDYRFAFWFAALFVVTALAVVALAVPGRPDGETARAPFDLTGAVLLGTGLGSLLLGISEGPTWGWASPWTVGVLVVAVGLLAVWVRWSLRTRHPLINLRVFAHGEVLLANGSAIGLGAAIYIGLSVSSLVAQAPADTGFGLSMPVFWAGFVMLPLSVGSFLANRLVRRLSRRVPLTALLPVGAGLTAASGTLLWLAHSELWELLLGMFVFGLGIGSSYAAMPALIARNVAAEGLGSSVSFNQVLRTIGSSFGTAASAAILAVTADPAGQTTDAGITGTFGLGAILCLGVCLALVAHAVVRRVR